MSLLGLVDEKIKNMDFSAPGFYTLETDSLYALKNSDFMSLDNPRPLGLSGHMRAKDEAITLRASVLSCIDVLDELILVVQPSKDETCEIARALSDEHPKIRLYTYEPEVMPFVGSHVPLNGSVDTSCSFPPENSIHNFAHYYNFALTKIKYKYSLRIDADQIYFTDKLRALKDAILASDKYTRPTRGIVTKIISRLMRPFEPMLLRTLGLFRFVKLISIINGRVAFSLCGLNLCIKDTELLKMGGGG